VGEETFAGMGGKEEVAPISDLRLMPMASRGCAENGS
jgi:hypothetical protein